MVARYAAGLSVNREHNLLVMGEHRMKLQMWDTRGTLLQEIQLQADIGCRRHAVQLTTGQYVLSHDYFIRHFVSLLGVEGTVVPSYGRERQSGDLS